MEYIHLAYLHLATVVPAFLLGTYQLVSRKGSQTHRLLGRVYMLLMLFTALLTLFMPASISPWLFNHFGPIHLFSLLTLYAVPVGYFAARRKDMGTHKRSMILLYMGAIVIAGSFALAPGRMLHQWLFGG